MLATTLCLTLLNLPLVITCKYPQAQFQNQYHWQVEKHSCSRPHYRNWDSPWRQIAQKKHGRKSCISRFSSIIQMWIQMCFEWLKNLFLLISKETSRKKLQERNLENTRCWCGNYYGEYIWKLYDVARYVHVLCGALQTMRLVLFKTPHQKYNYQLIAKVFIIRMAYIIYFYHHFILWHAQQNPIHSNSTFT